MYHFVFNCFCPSENIAKHQNCSQSTYYAVYHDCNYAVNGKTSGSFNYRQNCIHTAVYDSNPWWEVDLGNVYPIRQMIIWGRTEDGSTLIFFTCCIPALRSLMGKCTKNKKTSVLF